MVCDALVMYCRVDCGRCCLTWGQEALAQCRNGGPALPRSAVCKSPSVWYAGDVGRFRARRGQVLVAVSLWVAVWLLVGLKG